jgi:membrane-bound lytic murein transglycosylase B
VPCPPDDKDLGRSCGVIWAPPTGTAGRPASLATAKRLVHPGRTRTEKTAEFVERQAKAQGVTRDEIERRLASANLVRRVITADEIAYLVAFLASPKSIAINGDSIVAGGGSPGAIHY